MSCPSCQVGGRRLPSLPLGYIGKTRVNTNIQHINLFQHNYSVPSICSERIEKNIHSLSLEDKDVIQRYLHENPSIVEEFVIKNVSQEKIERWLICKCEGSSGTKGERNDRNLSRWKFCVHKDKRKMLENLTKEINQHKTKCSVIYELMTSIAHAVHADRYILYVVDDSGMYLTTYSANLTRSFHTMKQDIQTSTTISAFVARQKEMVFVTEILGDDRFPSGTGQDGTDQSVICQPIFLSDQKLYGVVEFVKTANSVAFDSQDLEITCSYLTWGSVAVHYCEVAQQLRSLNNIDEFVNQFAKQMLDETRSLKQLTQFIMNFAMNATESSSYCMYQCDPESNDLYTHDTNIKDADGNKIILRLPSSKGIAGHVIETGEFLNIKDPYKCPFFSRDIDIITGDTTSSILAAPISRNGRNVGVIQLNNNRNGVFQDQDMNILKLCCSCFNIIFGSDQLRADIQKKITEITVLKEVLAYCAKPSDQEISEVEKPVVFVDIPDDFYKFSFNYFKNGDQFGFWFAKLARELFKSSKLSYSEKKLVRFIATVKGHYRDQPYHNWLHAFSVAHFMYVLQKAVGDKMPKLEVLAMIFACICHDLDHRGRSNAFIQQTNHPLASLYDRSLMENHHFYMARFILQQNECNVFSNLTSGQEARVYDIMEKCIIATDLLKSFGYRDRLREIIESGVFDWQSGQHRELASFVMMTMSDLCGSCKPWEIHQQSSYKVFEEFYQQADEEISKGMIPLSMFTKKNELALNQIGFINGIVMPCVATLEPIIPELGEVADLLLYCTTRWKERAKLDIQLNLDDPAKLEQINVPGSSLQERSISFVRYNCSGYRGVN